MKSFKPRRIRRKSKSFSWQFIQALPQAERNRLTESDIQMALVQYIRERYPGVLFKCDTSAIKLTLGQAVKMKKLGNTRAWPDMFIAEPRKRFHGCYIELKREGERIRRENGNWASDHIAEQAEMLDALEKRGYYTGFYAGFPEARRAIDWYLE